LKRTKKQPTKFFQFCFLKAVNIILVMLTSLIDKGLVVMNTKN
jgi:hypothetical protein